MANRGVAPLDPQTPVGQLRALLRDTSFGPLTPPEAGFGNYAVFSDVDLAVYLAQNPDSLNRAAGEAIRSLALEVAAGERSVKTDDLAVDLRGRGKSLMEIAQSFFDDADAAEAASAADFFQVVPFPATRQNVRPEGTPYPLPAPPCPAPSPAPSTGGLDGGTP